MSDTKQRKIKRRSFLKAAAALISSGALAWGVSKPPIEAVIGVDVGEPGGDETTFLVIDDDDVIHDEYPFVPYYLPPGATWTEIPEFRPSEFDERED